MTVRRLLALLVAAAAMTASFLPSAEAQAEREVTDRINPADFLYWEDGFLVMTASAAQFCAGGPPPMLPGVEIIRPNGSVIWRTRGHIETSVYEIPDIPRERLDLIYEWLLANCDTEPYASGTTLSRSKFRFDVGGVLHIRNGLNGVLVGAEGQNVRVNTFARVNVDAATGALIDLQELRVRVTSQ